MTKYDKVSHKKVEHKKTTPLKKHPLLARFFPVAITGRRKMEKSR